MPRTIEQWHARFVEQSAWTAPLRAFLFSQVNMEQSSRLLEVGCGTGAITQSLHDQSSRQVHGIDKSFASLDFADQTDSLTNFSCADALALPFQPDYFDITFCHYFLLWLPGHALDTLHEMIRVTRPGGAVLAMAEPAYTKRIDYPQNLEPLGNLQTLALEKQGADPAMGLRLPELFSQAGLKEIRFGQSGFQNTVGEVPDWLDSEWDTFKDDLRELVPSSELNDLETLDRQAWANGSRILHIPTFYGIGIVKE